MWRDRWRAVLGNPNVVEAAWTAAPEPVNPSVPVVLAEFGALREEITGRLDRHSRFVIFNFIFVATILGVVYGHVGTSHRLLFFVPIGSALLGLQWLENLYAMALMGRYIREQQWDHLRRTAGNMPSWEDYWSRNYSGPLAATLGGGVPFGSFGAPAIIVLVMAARAQHEGALDIASIVVDGLTIMVTIAIALWTYRRMQGLDAIRWRVGARAALSRIF